MKSETGFVFMAVLALACTYCVAEYEDNEAPNMDEIQFEEPDQEALEIYDWEDDIDSSPESRDMMEDPGENEEIEKRNPWGVRRWGGRRSFGGRRSWGGRRSSWGSRRRSSWRAGRRSLRFGSRRRSTSWRSTRRRSSSWRSTRRRSSSWRSTRRRSSGRSKRRRSLWRSTRRRTKRSTRRRSSWRLTRRRSSGRSTRRRSSWRLTRRRTSGRSTRRRSSWRRFTRRRSKLRRTRKRRQFWRRVRSRKGRKTRVTRKVGGWIRKAWEGVKKMIGKGKFRISVATGGSGGGSGGGGGGSGGETGGGSGSVEPAQPKCDRTCKMQIRKLLNFVKILKQSYCAFYGAKKYQSDYLKFRDDNNATALFDRYINDSLMLYTQEATQIQSIDATMKIESQAQLIADCLATKSKTLPCKNPSAGTVTAFQKLKCAAVCKGNDTAKCQASDEKLVTAIQNAVNAYAVKIETVPKKKT